LNASIDTAQTFVLGCGVNVDTMDIFFTRDGEYMGIALNYRSLLSDVWPPPTFLSETSNQFALHAAVSFLSYNDHRCELDFNFGQKPFAFNLRHPDLWMSFGKGQSTPYAFGEYGAVDKPVAPWTPERIPAPAPPESEGDQDTDEDMVVNPTM
jgi:hypothetical protein